MRLSTKLLILLVTLLISATALGGKKKSRTTESNPNMPVVAVADLKVDSTNDGVRKKIAGLTNKVRDAVSESTVNCAVINTRKMRALNRRYARKLAAFHKKAVLIRPGANV